MSDDKTESESVLGKFTGDVSAGDETEEITTSGGYKPVGFHPMTKHAVWLELRFKTGDSEALRYAFIHRVSYNKSTGIVIHHTDGKASIRGSNLEKLHELLLRDRAIYVQEFGRTEEKPLDGETCISEITFE